MCAGCFTHMLADAQLRDEMATCPNCRIEISKSLASRNLAVENAVSELPAECQFCGKEFPRNSLDRHEESECEERWVYNRGMNFYLLIIQDYNVVLVCFRVVTCQFSRIGCPWRGPKHELTEHELVCVHPHRTGAEIMEALCVMDAKREEEKRLYDCVFDLLSYERCTFAGKA